MTNNEIIAYIYISVVVMLIIFAGIIIASVAVPFLEMWICAVARKFGLNWRSLAADNFAARAAIAFYWIKYRICVLLERNGSRKYTATDCDGWPMRIGHKVSDLIEVSSCGFLSHGGPSFPDEHIAEIEAVGAGVFRNWHYVDFQL